MDKKVLDYLKNKKNHYKDVISDYISQIKDGDVKEKVVKGLMKGACTTLAVLTLASCTNMEKSTSQNNMLTLNNTPVKQVVVDNDNNLEEQSSQTPIVAEPEKEVVVENKNTPFSVMTYNVLKSGFDYKYPEVHHWQYRKEIIFWEIDESNPDIIAFQEVDTTMFDDLYHDLNDEYVNNIQSMEDYEGIKRKNTIFFRRDRFELVDTGMFWLSDTPEQPSESWGTDQRCCSWAKLHDKKDDVEFYVYNIHYTYKSQDKEARKNSTELIKQRVAELDAPVILLGDFNANESEPAYKNLMTDFEDTLYAADTVIDSGRTYYGFDRDERILLGDVSLSGNNEAKKAIDHIFVSKDKNGNSAFEVNSFELMDNYTENFINAFGNVTAEEAVMPKAGSDHLAVMSEIKLAETKELDDKEI